MYCVISGCGFPVKVYHNAMEAMTNDPWKKMIYHDWFKIVIFPQKKLIICPRLSLLIIIIVIIIVVIIIIIIIIIVIMFVSGFSSIIRMIIITHIGQIRQTPRAYPLPHI